MTESLSLMHRLTKNRDRIVCGVRNTQIQKRLLSEKDITYDKAVEISIAMEAAARDATEL